MPTSAPLPQHAGSNSMKKDLQARKTSLKSLPCRSLSQNMLQAPTSILLLQKDLILGGPHAVQSRALVWEQVMNSRCCRSWKLGMTQKQIRLPRDLKLRNLGFWGSFHIRWESSGIPHGRSMQPTALFAARENAKISLIEPLLFLSGTEADDLPILTPN